MSPDAATAGVVAVRWLALDVDDADQARCASLLDADETARVGRLATDELRRRLTVRLATRREVLGAELGVAPGRLEVRHEASGQPFVLAPDGARISVSASSRGALGVLASCRGLAVGVDVEAAGELGDERRLAERIASDVEREALGALGGDARRTAMLRLWTRKEAYLKATGEGIGAGLRRITVPLGRAAAGERFDPEGDGTSWVLYELACPIEGLGAALVVGPVDPGAATPELDVTMVPQGVRLGDGS